MTPFRLATNDGEECERDREGVSGKWHPSGGIRKEKRGGEAGAHARMISAGWKSSCFDLSEAPIPVHTGPPVTVEGKKKNGNGRDGGHGVIKPMTSGKKKKRNKKDQRKLMIVISDQKERSTLSPERKGLLLKGV